MCCCCAAVCCCYGKKRNKIYSAVLAISFFADESYACFYIFSIGLVKLCVVKFFCSLCDWRKDFSVKISHNSCIHPSSRACMHIWVWVAGAASNKRCPDLPFPTHWPHHSVPKPAKRCNLLIVTLIGHARNTSTRRRQIT